MRYSTVYERLFSQESKPGILVLIDPDKVDRDSVEEIVQKINEHDGVKAILVGTSVLLSDDFDEFVSRVRKVSKFPVIIFPGNSLQVSKNADAFLLPSLISGRNPDFLIGEHVKIAVFLKNSGIEVIPTGYMLVESGNYTSVEYISFTRPIPREKIDIAIAHAVAGELLGLKLLYLEAGSGAKYPVPPEMIKSVVDSVSIPVIVGGGLRTRKDVENAINSGASHVVIGTAFEEDPEILQEVL